MSEKSPREAERMEARRPRRIALAAVLCGAQGAVLAGVGALLLVFAVGGDSDDLGQAVAGGLTLLALAGIPLMAGHGLWRLRRWSRGPAVMAQLLGLPISFTLLGSGGAWVVAALALAGSVAVVLGSLLSPTATEALGVGPERA
ncbi:hypothetical protein [Streptomyces profundus]|uniref:hypothetical protein n=1 Tax=Streptomyces profundus TaxID=2867410 RepID=UPI001D16EC6E|nr:hypothetical protein [Streptomyces sp. MA3_2.13]UED84230.1 hypothetical protein K4G22_08420 [Streptomyces sp. MA3_2.13]